MGYYTTVTGSFEIVPPLKGKEMSGFTEEDIPYGLSGEIIETHKEVDDGTLVIRSLEHIYADGDSFKAYTFENDLQAMVSRFPGHKWVGRVQGEGEEQGDMWRLYIRDGKVIRHEVKNMWPEAPPED